MFRSCTNPRSLLSSHIQVTELNNTSDLLIVFLFGINFSLQCFFHSFAFFYYHTQLLIVIRQCSSQGIPYSACSGYFLEEVVSILNLCTAGV